MTSGMVLGRFRLIEKIDACDAAARYTAQNGEHGAWIELLSAEVSDTAIQRLKDQRAVLAKLKKAKAPEVLEFGEADRRTFVAIRRPPGETLAVRIRRGGLGAIETLDLLIELAEALAETHGLGIAHGRLSENSIYFSAGGAREEMQILGYGLAGLAAGVNEQPTPESDLRALGSLAYLCLAGAESDRTLPPGAVLEKQPHLSREARTLVLRLLEGEGVDSAAAVAELARAARRAVTTDIVPIKPSMQRSAAKIEVVLRATVDAVDSEEALGPTPVPDIAAPHDEKPTLNRNPGQSASPLIAPPPATKLDARTLFIAGAILIALIVGLWLVTSSSHTSQDVVVESLDQE